MRIAFPRIERTVRYVERNELAQLLDISGYASGACRHALLGGAGFIVWDGAVPASQILPAYERRAVRTVADGTPTLGFADTVAALRRVGSQPVRLGQVTVTDPPYLFMLFLSDDASTVVGCLGIDQTARADHVAG
jgi:hypothetical protein